MSNFNYSNPKYSGSPATPLSIGDRHYAQDLFRDFRYTQEQIGLAYSRMFGKDTAIIEGLNVSQGTGHTINITSGKAITLFTVTLISRSGAWAVPPTTETDDIVILIRVNSDITNQAIAGAVTDGTTVNYVKLAYTETDGNTRPRARKAGTYAYEVEPDYVLSVNDTPATNYEVTLETFTTDGTTITFLGNEDDREDATLSDIKNYLYRDENFTIDPNNQFYSENVLDISLPTTAVVGDFFTLYNREPVQIIQTDTAHIIKYKNKYQSTQGTTGKLQLPDRTYSQFLYRGEQEKIIEPSTKLPDPADLPIGAITKVAFSQDTQYLAIGGAASFTILKRSGDTFTKIPDVNIMPSVTSAVRGLHFSPNGDYLGIAIEDVPYILIYKLSGDNFNKLPNPTQLPSTEGNVIRFSWDNRFLAIGSRLAPFLYIYERSEDNFTLLSDPSPRPSSSPNSLDFSREGRFLSVVFTSSPFIRIYRIQTETIGATFLNLPTIGNPGSGVNECRFTPDTKNLVLTLNGGTFWANYRIGLEDTLTLRNVPVTGINNSAGSMDITRDGKYLTFSTSSTSTDKLLSLRITEAGFEVLAPPSSLPVNPPTAGGSVAYSSDGKYLAVANGPTNPPVFIYKNTSSVGKVWDLLEIDTLYPDNDIRNGLM